MEHTDNKMFWRLPLLTWLLIAASAFLVGFLFRDGIHFMFLQWELPEYNFGYLIPAIALFLLWQKKDLLQSTPFEGSWLGTALLLVGIGVLLLGQMSAVIAIVHYAMVLVIAGLMLSQVGTKHFRHIWVAAFILLFMIPLPGFLYQTLSNDLQLLSSRIGVWLIRLFGISVYLEGNVIDLGVMKLQVVEACSGLRYLFPLLTLGFIAAYFFKAALWKRSLVFLSAAPITVLMNSFRIGAIGILVEYWGRGMAEGFLHDFEGWIIFMVCTGILVLEMWLLTTLSKDKRPLAEVFGIELPAPTPKGSFRAHPVPMPFIAGFSALVLAASATVFMPKQIDIVPARDEFTAFPTEIAEWKGRKEIMEQQYIASLNFDDYLMANYLNGQKQLVNFYIGYYATQRADKVPHSPRACLPSGGWSITSFERRELPGVNGILPVNRAIIEQRGQKQLVYYWFKQRSRMLTDEFQVKWFIFWDSLTMKRTDGALIRLVTPVYPHEEIAHADARLAAFAAAMQNQLPTYIPD